MVTREYSVGRRFLVLLMVRKPLPFATGNVLVGSVEDNVLHLPERKALVFSPSTTGSSQQRWIYAAVWPTMPVTPSSKLMTILSAKTLESLDL